METLYWCRNLVCSLPRNAALSGEPSEPGDVFSILSGANYLSTLSSRDNDMYGMIAGECIHESIEGEFLRKKYKEAVAEVVRKWEDALRVVACILLRSAVIIATFHWP